MVDDIAADHGAADRVLVGVDREDGRAGPRPVAVLGGEPVALILRPAEVRTPGAVARLVVDLLLRVLTDVPDRDPPAVERESPRVTEAPREDLIQTRLADQGVGVRNREAPVRTRVDAEDLAEQRVELVRLV